MVLMLVGLAACSDGGEHQAQPERQESAAAEGAQPDCASYSSHSEAAIAAALDADPGLVDPIVTNAVVIFTSDTTVDLRAKVETDDGHCEWFGVSGVLDATTIRWQAGPPSTCDK